MGVEKLESSYTSPLERVIKKLLITYGFYTFIQYKAPMLSVFFTQPINIHYKYKISIAIS
jgi:hypothetical protein